MRRKLIMSKLEWHFMDYPTTEDAVLVKTVDGELLICERDIEHNRWLDVGRDRSWFTGGVACWAYVTGVPETDKPMPIPVPNVRRA